MSDFGVVIAAAGGSKRFHDKFYKKQFVPLAERAVWLYSAEKFLGRDDVGQVILVISAEDREEFMRKFGANVTILGVDVCDGGAERSDSVAAALEKLNDKVKFVAVHDAARPCITDKEIDQVFGAAKKHGAAILATPVTSTLKRAASPGSAPSIAETVSRESLWAAQTPQVFRRDLLEKAYAQRSGAPSTDDAQLLEQSGIEVRLVEGRPTNIKITTKDDVKLAEQILRVLPRPKPQGMSHPFANDDLWR